MKKRKGTRLAIIAIFFSAFVLISDIFFHPGEWESYDIRAHIRSLALFYQSFVRGELFVRWVEGWNNYGYPLGQIAHQVPAYLGGLINFFTLNPLLSFKILFFIALSSSVLILFFLLKKFFSWEISLIASLFFNFTAYRIFNLYVRAALPEIFSLTFALGIILGLDLLSKENSRRKGFALTTISTTLLLLTHPFSIFIYFPLELTFFLYFLKLQKKKKERLKYFIWSITSFVFGFLIASYYLLPLKLEKKYFYAGQGKPTIAERQFKSLRELVNERWNYASESGSSVREDFVQLGIWESIVFILFYSILFVEVLRKKKGGIYLKILIGIFGTVTFFLILKPSVFVYKAFPLLSEIQFPWRFLGTLGVFISFMFAFILSSGFSDLKDWKKRIWGILVAIFIISFLIFRLKQVYVKNSVIKPSNFYYFTKDNPHSVTLNPVWMSKGEDYPVKKQKLEVVEGRAVIEKKDTSKFNIHRYVVKVLSDRARFADYTFYFPGWRLYIDGSVSNIQYQDPNYRGIMTFYVPKGEHKIELKYEETKVRKISDLLSLTSLLIFALLSLSFGRVEKGIERIFTKFSS